MESNTVTNTIPRITASARHRRGSGDGDGDGDGDRDRDGDTRDSGIPGAGESTADVVPFRLPPTNAG
jgi:hypothetical protein